MTEHIGRQFNMETVTTDKFLSEMPCIENKDLPADAQFHGRYFDQLSPTAASDVYKFSDNSYAKVATDIEWAKHQLGLDN